MNQEKALVRGLLRDYEPSDGPSFQALHTTHSTGAPCLTAPCCRPRSPTPTWAAAVSPPRPASRTSTGAAASGAARAAAAELRPGTAVR